MSNRETQKEKLDCIGRRLLEATRVSNDELEKIVSSPKLFDSVKARIKIEQKPVRKAKANFFNWNIQTASAAFAILLVALAAIAVIVFQNRNLQQTAQKINKNEVSPVAIQPESLPPVPEIAGTKPTEVKNSSPAAEKTDFKPEPKNLPERRAKQNVNRLEENHKTDQKVVFYPLDVAGNWEANGEDLRVVRADLSRAELFALGVNLPVENENTKIKTDLLVGADGVARAIRLVE